jgi:hypothetical protein
MRYRASAAALAATVALTLAACAEDPPRFREGLWEFDRSSAGRTMHQTRCASPSDDMRWQNEMIERGGLCKFSARDRAENSYTFTADCEMRSFSGGTLKTRSVSVMTVESDSAYRIEVTTTGPGPPITEVLTARRLGDC